MSPERVNVAAFEYFGVPARLVCDNLKTGVDKPDLYDPQINRTARRGGDIGFVKCARTLADLAGGHADRTIGQRMREYTRSLVLIVDDFAMREHTTTQSDDLYVLVSDRAIAGKPLNLTSNRTPKDLVSTLAEPAPSRNAAAGPTDKHQPPNPHGRTVLPTLETTGPHHQVDNLTQHRYDHHRGHTWGTP